MKRKTNKRGFTLAELVIAMAIVVLVSATAITLVLSSRKAELRIQRDADATRLAENAWECFKATETPEEFAEALSFAEEGKTVLSDAGVYTVTSDRYDYTATLTADAKNLEVVIMEEDGDEILRFSYRKGGGAS